ncbi:hypothetical protein TanjilG_10443 [Lupinus angustifolius]|uniref:Uncharacterized protein n=1 Tax=Lupinus angustifolius TaxID=3871 RepID=A0A4P1R4A1_LUPAN|nr:hypothetical protein TanjilG_10443 [Lupinus angustifolius]
MDIIGTYGEVYCLPLAWRATMPAMSHSRRSLRSTHVASPPSKGLSSPKSAQRRTCTRGVPVRDFRASKTNTMFKDQLQSSTYSAT